MMMSATTNTKALYHYGGQQPGSSTTACSRSMIVSAPPGRIVCIDQRTINLCVQVRSSSSSSRNSRVCGFSFSLRLLCMCMMLTPLWFAKLLMSDCLLILLRLFRSVSFRTYTHTYIHMYVKN